MGRQAKAKKRRGPRYRNGATGGGRPQVHLTEEQRTELHAVLFERVAPIWEGDVTLELWREEVAPRLMDIGLMLRQLADAIEMEKPTGPLLAKINRKRTAALKAIDDSPASAARAERGEQSLATRIALAEMALMEMDPVKLRSRGKVLIDAAERHTGISARDVALRRKHRSGNRGPLPDLSMRYLAQWILHRRLSVRAVAREISAIGLEVGLVPSSDAVVEEATRIEEILRKAIDRTDGK